MTESEINLDTISNLKHRAILQALLTTDLSVNAISRKLQCTSGAIYYCISRYLYKGFSDKRNKQIQLRQLSSCANKYSEPESASSDLVTEVKILPSEVDSEVRALPAVSAEKTALALQEDDEADISRDNNEKEKIQAESNKAARTSKNITLTRTQLKIYDFINNIIQKYQTPFFPRENKIYHLYKKTYGIGFSRRDFYIVKKKWLSEHELPDHKNSPLHNSNTEEDNTMELIKNPVLGFQDHILKIEYQGLKLSMDLDERKVSLEEITSLFKTVLKI